MKQFYRIFARIVLFFAVFPATLYGQQEAGGLFLSGKITTEQGNVNGAAIRMSRNGQPMKDYQVLPDGRFDLRFEFNNDYVLIFTRPENFSQKLTIDTHVPADVLRRDRKFPPFPVDISLFTEIKGIDRTFSENAIMKIFYSPAVDNFISEVYYNNPQIKKLIDQAIWQSQNVTRESDLLKRLTAAELAELKKDYDELLQKAGSEFDKGEYIASLGDYKSASRIFPHEQYPKDRIAEINDLIAILGLQAELDKQTAEKYSQFIREADRQFTARDFPPSKENYTQALYVRPGDTYATGRINEIDRITAEAERARLQAEMEAADKARMLSEQEQRELKYKGLIEEADGLAGRELLVEAVGKFRAAMEVKPQEAYPLRRIEEIRGIIARQTEARKAYEAAVATGDQEFKKEQYGAARTAYLQAQQAKSDEKYPGEMIARIDALEAEQKRLEAEKMAAEEAARLASQAAKEIQYQDAIDAADQSFNRQQYTQAIAGYRNAMKIKPGEVYPTERIVESEAIIAELAAAQKAYDAAIASADKAFRQQQYRQARRGYEDAQKAKSGETYPGEMLEKIDALEEEMTLLAEEKTRIEAEKQARELAAKEAAEAEKQRLAEEKARLEAERLAKLEAERQAAEAERARLAEEKARVEAEKQARELAAKEAAEAEKQRLSEEKARLEAERLSKLEAERQAAEAEKARLAEEKARVEAEKQARELAAKEAAEAEKQRLAEEKARLEAERIAKLEAERQAAEAERARLAEEKARLEAERLAKLEAERQAAEAEKARLAEEKARVEAEKQARELAAKEAAEAEKLRLAEEKARLEAERLAKLEAERQAAEAERVRIAEEKARIEAERIAKLEAEKARLAEEKARVEAEKQARELAAKEAAEAEKQRLAEEKARLEAERLAKLEAERQAAEAEKARLAEEKARVEAEKQARELAAKEAAEAEKLRLAEEKARLEAERLAKLEAERQAAEAERVRIAEEKARIEAERIAKLEAEKARLAEEKARVEAEKQARELAAKEAAEAEKQRLAEEKARLEAEQLAKLEAERQAAEAEKARLAAEKAAREEAARLASLAVQDRRYGEAVARGDEFFNQKQYTQAINLYRNALKEKPGENYPQQRITESETLLANLAAAQNVYNEAVAEGDKAFRQQQYAPARQAFGKAQQAKSEEKYPGIMLARIDAIEAEQAKLAGEKARMEAERLAKLEAERQAAEAERVRLAEEKARVEAEKQARELAAKEAAEAEKQRLAEEKTRLEAERLAKLEGERQAAETEKARLSAEKAAREEAARLASLKEPAAPPAPVRTITDETSALYDGIIATADQAFNDKEYNVSRAWYYKALEVKAGEPYPIARIDEINRILGSLQLTQLEREFQEYINKGDEAFRADQLAVARGWYNRSLNIKPTDGYPKSQIADIQMKISERLQGNTENAYKGYIDEGDKALGEKKYNIARVWYHRARQLRPSDPLAGEKLENVRKAMAGE